MERIDPERAFFGSPGQPVPTVDPDDLRAVWLMLRRVEEEHPGQQVATGFALMKNLCKPGADVSAVCYRSMVLKLLAVVRPDETSLLLDENTNKAVFQVAATMPMEWIGVGVVREGFPFDVEDFYRRLHDQSGPAS